MTTQQRVAVRSAEYASYRHSRPMTDEQLAAHQAKTDERIERHPADIQRSSAFKAML